MRLNLAGSLALYVLLVSAAWAQEPEEKASADSLDDFEPAVSTSELATLADDRDTEVGADSPAASVAQGVTRRQGTSGVMDELDLGRTEITGNQELPKVLYIVPWQKSGPAELMGKPVNTLLDEVLAPIDRTEFVRQVEYYDDLYREELQ